MALGLQSTGSITVVHSGLSCSAACGDLPGSGIEPMSPTLAGRFFIIEPPGKPCVCVLKDKLYHKFMLIFLIQIQDYRI